MKKVIKLLVVIVGLFLAALAYLQYHQIANINWNKLLVSSLPPDSGDGVIGTEGIDSGLVVVGFVLVLLSCFTGGKEEVIPPLRLLCCSATDDEACLWEGCIIPITFFHSL